MERKIKTKIGGIEYSFEVFDTDKTPLIEILKNDILWAYIWEDYYVFKLKTDDRYDALVYIVNRSTKKVEWGYNTGLGFVAEENGKSISTEELKRALA